MGGVVAKVAAIVVLCLGGLFGAGIIYDNHFGGQQREINQSQDKRLDANDEINRGQDVRLNTHNDEIEATKRRNREQDAHLRVHDEQIKSIDEKVALLEQNAAEVEAKIQELRGEIAKGTQRSDAQAEQLARLDARLS